MDNEDRIVIIGKYRSISKESRFHINKLRVNNSTKELIRTGFTKTNFAKLLSSIWPKLTTGKETKITITITRINDNKI